jgi:hypothetical protein
MTDIDMILLSGRAAPGLSWPSAPRPRIASAQSRADAEQPPMEPLGGSRCPTCGGPVREDEMAIFHVSVPRFVSHHPVLLGPSAEEVWERAMYGVRSEMGHHLMLGRDSGAGAVFARWLTPS